MAQTQLNAEYNPKFTPSQSQDGLEMRWYDHRPSTSTGKETDHRASTTMAKEDFAILTTSMDGINTAMNVLTYQINNHTSRVIKEMNEQTEKITKLMKEQTEKISKLLEERKTSSTTYRKKGACYICQDPGHYAPHCPTRRDPDYQGNPKNTRKNACFRCGETGHWVAQCPMKDIQDFEDFQEPAKKKRTREKQSSPRKIRRKIRLTRSVTLITKEK